MNTINDTGLVRLVEDTAANKIVADRSQWVARGDGVKPDGSDNAQVTSEASNIYLPIDGLRTDIKEFYDPYEIDDGDFIFAPYSSGTSCELRISNVKWSKDGVELYKVCGDALSDYGKSEDGLPWYKVDGYEECSTTQNIMAYLLEDDTIKITTASESNYKDKVLIATAKNGIINRIVKSVIMKGGQQTCNTRSWSIRNNGGTWEVFSPVWATSCGRLTPDGYAEGKWSAITDTSGDVYANLKVSLSCSEDGSLTKTETLSIDSSALAPCTDGSESVMSVKIGEFETTTDGNGSQPVVAFKQFTDGELEGDTVPKKCVTVVTSLNIENITEEITSEDSSPIFKTKSYVIGRGTPVIVPAGDEINEPPMFKWDISSLGSGGNGLVYGPPTVVEKPSGATGSTGGSGGTDANGGKALALKYPIGTIGPDGSFTECADLADKAVYVDLISHIVMKSAEVCSNTNEMVISYDRGYLLCAVEETQSSSGSSSSSGGTESKRFCMCRGMSLASFEPSYGNNSIVGFHGWYDEKNNKLHTKEAPSDGGVTVLNLLANENLLVCTAGSINSMTGVQYTVKIGNNVESEAVIVRQESQIVTGGDYNQPTEDGDVGSVSIKIASSKFAVFVGSTTQETGKVLLYTATASSQSGDTYSGMGNS